MYRLMPYHSSCARPIDVVIAGLLVIIAVELVLR